VGIALDLEAEVLKVAVSVGVAVGEVDLITVIDEVVVPRERKVGLILSGTLTIAILVILYILTSPVPAEILLLGLPLGVDDDLHAHLVEVVHLVLVEDVEAHLVVLEGVGHFEEEPLGVAVGVDVVLQEKVVLTLGYF